MKVFFFSGKFVNMFGRTKKFKGYFLKEHGSEEIAGYLLEEGKPHEDAVRGLFDESAAKLLLVKTTNEESFSQEIYMFIFQGDFSVGKLSPYNHGYKTFSAYSGLTYDKVGLDVLTSVSMSQDDIQEIQDIYSNSFEASTKRSKRLAGNVKKYMWLFDYLKLFERSAK